MFFKWAFPGLFFSLFSYLQQLTENAYVHYKTLPMTKLELETSINWATTSACQDNFCRYKMWSSSWLFSRLQVAKALTNPIHRENILWIARARGTTFSFEVSLENWSKLWEAICFFHFMLLLFFIWLFRRDVGTFVIETLRSPSAYFGSCILPSRFTKCIVFIFISMAQI